MVAVPICFEDPGQEGRNGFRERQKNKGQKDSASFCFRRAPVGEPVLAWRSVSLNALLAPDLKLAFRLELFRPPATIF